MNWDLFCRVIDNHGDVGVCWRLASELAARGETVRLWIDDPVALAWMAPGGREGVSVFSWPRGTIDEAPGDVVIEAFGCSLPNAFLQQMLAACPGPVWINLEYLSAEPFVEGSHGLPSPQLNGLRKRFFYPGFTPATGGLIRERDLDHRQRSFDGNAWLRDRGVTPKSSEQLISLFCYDNSALPSMIDRWSARPTLLLVTPGYAERQVREVLGMSMQRGALRAVTLPLLTQRSYDELLWACDLNLVRGEDSFVRAQWAGKPFIWQIYPQADKAHQVKLDAFLRRFLAQAESALGRRLSLDFLGWNSATGAEPEFDVDAQWRNHCKTWRDALLLQSDLVTRLTNFARESS